MFSPGQLLWYNFIVNRRLLKEKVRVLRANGRTYNEITQKIGVEIAKSTLSNWCRGVNLPKGYKDKVAKLNKTSLIKARVASFVSNQIKKERFFKEIFLKNKQLIEKSKDKDVLRIMLSFLYLGEGSKWKSHRGLMLGSSDPNIIKIYVRLLRLCYGFKAFSLKCRISYRADQDLRKLESYWSKITSIPLSNFYKTKPDPRTIGKATKRVDYKGVCVIMCSGTSIQLELEEIPKMILKGL